MVEKIMPRQTKGAIAMCDTKRFNGQSNARSTDQCLHPFKCWLWMLTDCASHLNQFHKKKCLRFRHRRWGTPICVLRWPNTPRPDPFHGVCTESIAPPEMPADTCTAPYPTTNTAKSKKERDRGWHQAQNAVIATFSNNDHLGLDVLTLKQSQKVTQTLTRC